jgi:hypothetical protein
MVFALDAEPPKEVMDELSALPFIDAVHYIQLPDLET